MRVAVTGGTGVIGRAVVPTLVAAGHDVTVLARTPDKAELVTRMGATPVRTGLADHRGLVALFDGADAACNFATSVPVGVQALSHRAWRSYDRLRTDGVRRVVEAARAAGVRRMVQESVSFLYADAGDEVVDEDAPVAITRATEPAAVGESHLQGFACDSRAAVVLRFGLIVGDDPQTRFMLRLVRWGLPVGLGSPEGWAHLVHPDDLGPAVLAALVAPSGVYNVGAEPVRRFEMVAAFAAAAGRESVDFVGPLGRRLGGVRLEPMARSLRVSSERFTSATGWEPRRPKLDSTWFAPASVHQTA
jgi:nucleoside-diphosphate-sugar epimerase